MTNGLHDFDFLMGKWTVRHHRLKHRLAGCTEWEDFSGESSFQPLLGGYGNVDDNVIHLPDGPYRAASLRAFDPGTGDWRIWWLDGRNPTNIDIPVVGRFEGNTGTFLAKEVIGDKPVVVRFLWTRTDTATPHWEQAFSLDDGRSWETNWTMEFERAAS